MHGLSASSGISRKKTQTAPSLISAMPDLSKRSTTFGSRSLKTFAPLDVVVDIEKFVGALEISHRQIDALFPDRQIFRVARLHFDQFLATRLAYAGIFCRSFIGLFVDADQLGDRIALK